MKRHDLAAWVLVVGGTGGFCAALGCEQATGIPTSQRITSFWRNTVQPLWKYGPNPELPPTERLEWIKPERHDNPPRGRHGEDLRSTSR